MRKRDALKLHNRDEVRVHVSSPAAAKGEWVTGYVLGEPREEAGRVVIPVQTEGHGWQEVDHTDIR